MLARKNDPRVNELLDALEKIKGDFDLIQKPSLEVETRTPKAKTPSKVRLQKCHFFF